MNYGLSGWHGPHGSANDNGMVQGYHFDTLGGIRGQILIIDKRSKR